MGIPSACRYLSGAYFFLICFWGSEISVGSLDDEWRGQSITKFSCHGNFSGFHQKENMILKKLNNIMTLKIFVNHKSKNSIYNKFNHFTYIVPSAFRNQLSTSEVEALATTFLKASKSSPFDATTTAFYPSTSCYLRSKIDGHIIFKVHIRGPLFKE